MLLRCKRDGASVGDSASILVNSSVAKPSVSRIVVLLLVNTSVAKPSVTTPSVLANDSW